ELIDNHLRGIHKVSELRLPQDERTTRSDAVTVFEAESTRFGKRAVVDLEARFVSGDRCKGSPFGSGLGVHERGMSMAEGSTNRVLTGDSDRCAFNKQRPKGESLGGSPVDRYLTFNHLRASSQQPHNLRVQVEAAWDQGQGANNGPKSGLIYACLQDFDGVW